MRFIYIILEFTLAWFYTSVYKIHLNNCRTNIFFKILIKKQAYTLNCKQTNHVIGFFCPPLKFILCFEKKFTQLTVQLESSISSVLTEVHKSQITLYFKGFSFTPISQTHSLLYNHNTVEKLVCSFQFIFAWQTMIYCLC